MHLIRLAQKYMQLAHIHIFIIFIFPASFRMCSDIRWRDIWGEESVDRVAKALLQRLGGTERDLIDQTSQEMGV